MTLVMGVDSSTQATKVDIRRLDTGAVVATGRAPHPATVGPGREQSPDAWWQALVEAFGAAGRPGLGALAVAGQQHGLVALDRHDQVIRPARLWNDTEAAPDAARLVDELGPAAWAAACGSVPVAAFTVAKLAWLARTEPANFGRLRTVLLPHDWLTHRLTGARTTDRGDASGTGFWSPAEERWRPDLLDLVDHDLTADDWLDRLPRVAAPTELVGAVSPAAARALELPGSPPVVAAGTGDNMAAALGVALTPGDVAVSLGTSGTVFAVAAAPTADPSGAVAGFADATGRFLPLVCTLNATQVTDTFARLLGVPLDTLDAMAATVPLGADGVVLVPYLDGERTPNRPTATGTLQGLRTDATREQLARAAYEGVVCGLLDGLDALRAAGAQVDHGRLVLVGGGARSPRYRQVLADLTGRPVSVAPTDELVSAGAAVQAAAALTGAEPADVARAWGFDRHTLVTPDPAVTDDHRAAVRAAYAAARG